MKKAIHFMYIFVAIFFVSNCNNGYKVDSATFRAVADFAVPKSDSPTGTAVFTPNLTTGSVSAENFETIDEQTRFLTIKNPAEETTITFTLSIDGLEKTEFGNVKVTAEYTSLDASSAGLVKGVLFDSYGLMVFAPPNPSLQYDPSKSIVTVKLNTAAANQLGILTFKFEYAQSVYSSKCLSELNVFLATSSTETIRVLYSRIRQKNDNAKFHITNKYLEAAGVFTDLSRTEINQQITVPLVLELLNVSPNSGFTMRAENSSNIQLADISTSIEGKKGFIFFNLVLPAGTYNASGVSAACTLVVESTDGAAGLPLSVSLNILRKPNQGTKKVSVTLADLSAGLTASGSTYTYLDKVKNSATASLPLGFTASIVNLDEEAVQVSYKTTGAVTLQNTNTAVNKTQSAIPVSFTVPGLANMNEEKTGTITIELSDYSPLVYAVDDCVKSVTYTIVRKVPPPPDVQGVFATTGNASPWRWRMNYRVNTSSTASTNLGVATSVSNTLNSGNQNGFSNLETKYTYNIVSTTKEFITQTQNNSAIFLDNRQNVQNSGKQGDVLSSAGWLYSDVVELGEGFDYRINATISVATNGTQHNSDNTAEGKRVRLYLVPLTNEATEFTLANAGGSANISVTSANVATHGVAEIGKAYYFEFQTGTTNFEAVFASDMPTKMRVAIEKGAPDWGTIGNSKMAAQSVTVSNVNIVYN